MTIDDQIRSIVREEIGQIPEPSLGMGQLFLNVIGASLLALLMLDSIFSHANAIPERLKRLESRSVSEITVIHPDRRLERVVEPWGGGL